MTDESSVDGKRLVELVRLGRMRLGRVLRHAGAVMAYMTCPRSDRATIEHTEATYVARQDQVPDYFEGIRTDPAELLHDLLLYCFLALLLVSIAFAIYLARTTMKRVFSPLAVRWKSRATERAIKRENRLLRKAKELSDVQADSHQLRGELGAPLVKSRQKQHGAHFRRDEVLLTPTSPLVKEIERAHEMAAVIQDSLSSEGAGITPKGLGAQERQPQRFGSSVSTWMLLVLASITVWYIDYWSMGPHPSTAETSLVFQGVRAIGRATAAFTVSWVFFQAFGKRHWASWLGIVAFSALIVSLRV